MTIQCLQIGDNDMSGHRFNGHDLSNHLRDYGVISKHLVWEKKLDDPKCTEFFTGDDETRRMRAFFIDLNIKYSTRAKFFPYSHQLFHDQNFLNADVIHMHLIHNNFFDLRCPEH